MSDSKNPRYSRILLKLSGEALAGNKDMGIDAQVLDQMSLSIAHLVGLGVQVGIVVGGGNLYRGSQLQKDGLVGRVTGDQMGMLATVMNGLAMRDALVRRNIKTRLMSYSLQVLVTHSLQQIQQHVCVVLKLKLALS